MKKVLVIIAILYCVSAFGDEINSSFPAKEEMVNAAKKLIAKENERRTREQELEPKITKLPKEIIESPYNSYMSAVRFKIERVGTQYFPQHDNQRLYGSVDMLIPIFYDGTLYLKEGGPRVIRSSGNRFLDDAAIEAVRRAAPFGRFPQNLRTTDGPEVWEFTTTFSFSKGE